MLSVFIFDMTVSLMVSVNSIAEEERHQRGRHVSQWRGQMVSWVQEES